MAHIKEAYDYLIVGQGLAGTCVAMHLLDLDKTVCIVQDPSLPSSSRVAAGILNPLTGKKLVKTWLADDLFPYAHAFYTKMEQRLGARFFHQTSIYRPFRSIEEQNTYLAQTADPAIASYTAESGGIDVTDYVHADHGGIEVIKSGWVDLPLLLDTSKGYFQKFAGYCEVPFDMDDLHTGDDKIGWNGMTFGKIILCQGFEATKNAMFNWLPFAPVKGQILEIATEAVLKPYIINQGIFILPLSDKKCRVGATYSWNDLDWETTGEARAELETKLYQLMKGEYQVVDQVAGIRPSSNDRRPIAGTHPKYPNVCILNGLGTKGVTLGPFFANELVNNLEYGKELNPLVNIKRYFRYISDEVSLRIMSIRFIYKLTFWVNFFAFLGLFTDSIAQRYPSQETFGKNRVQHKTFKWKIFRTTNFEIYHYQGGTNLAKLTAQYAESEFDKITDVLGWTPYSRVKIFLYNTPAELEQSNMGLSTLDNLDDQKLDLAQSRVEVAYTGNQIGFRKKLVNDISLLFVYDMLYGGNMKEALQSSLLLTLPEWFMSGSAAYISEGWSPELNDYMRDFFKNRKVRKPTLLTGNDARMIGHSIWNYIAEKYGKDKISDILNLTRIIRNEQTSITSTLGVPSYNRFLRDWRAYYLNQTKNTEQFYVEPKPTWKIELSELTASEATAGVKVSPDKKWTAVSEVKNGRYRVYLVENEKGSKKIIRQGKADFIGGHLKTQAPLLGWARNNSLAILATENEKQNFFLYENLGTKKLRVKLRRTFKGLEQIVDMDISNDATMLAVSADKGGQNDLFLISVSRSSVMPLTNDLYDDVSPRFIQGSSRRVVFASNRPTDSLGTDKGNFKTITTAVSLFEHDGNPGSDHLTRLTQGAQKVKLSPVYADDNDVFYLSNSKGLTNLFRFNRASNTSNQLSNYFFNIRSADIALRSGGALAYTYLHDGNFMAGYVNSLDPNAAVNAPDIQSIGKPQDNTGTTSVKVDSAKQQGIEDAPKIVLKDGEVDIENYQFDEDVLKTFESRKARGSFPLASSALTRSKAVRENIAIKGPYPYKGLFITNDASSDWRIDPIRGFGYSQSLSMNDLLENHVIKAGVFVSSNFRNSDLFAEYTNNTHRIDFGIRVDRRALFIDTEASQQKYRFNQVMVTAAYPFSTTSRLSISPMYSSTRMIDVYNWPAPDNYSGYGGLRAEYVFDNTRVNGMNMMEGTRAKVRYDVQQGLSRAGESFNRFSLDIRHYQKIHRDLIFALRASASHSGGKAPKQNVMGGMENWIGNRKELRTGINPLAFGTNIDNRDIFFTDFATNLRGFNLNRLSGTSYMLLNAELRIPLVKYLYRGAITSSFLRDFQIVGFGDIGTAWTGKGPFSENNSLNTQVIGTEDDAFRAIVTNFKNPYLMGYGLGARTTLFGFYVKFDYAWGVDNGYTNKPIPYVTLGYDF